MDISKSYYHQDWLICHVISTYNENTLTYLTKIFKRNEIIKFLSKYKLKTFLHFYVPYTQCEILKPKNFIIIDDKKNVGSVYYKIQRYYYVKGYGVCLINYGLCHVEFENKRENCNIFRIFQINFDDNDAMDFNDVIEYLFLDVLNDDIPLIFDYCGDKSKFFIDIVARFLCLNELKYNFKTFIIHKVI